MFYANFVTNFLLKATPPVAVAVQTPALKITPANIDLAQNKNKPPPLRAPKTRDPMNPTKRWEKGWYIHPKTGQRIETDF